MKNLEIEKNIPLPTTPPRGRHGSSGYPFDLLEVGDSFHIPATESRPDPCKALASTVCAANKRFKVPCPKGSTDIDKKGNDVPVMVKTRSFIIRRVDDHDPKGRGARVFRIPLNE